MYYNDDSLETYLVNQFTVYQMNVGLCSLSYSSTYYTLSFRLIKVYSTINKFIKQYFKYTQYNKLVLTISNVNNIQHLCYQFTLLVTTGMSS